MAETISRAYYEYMKKIYGEVGAQIKLESAMQAGTNRYPGADARNLASMIPSRVHDPLTTTFQEDRVPWGKKAVEGLYSPSTQSARVSSSIDPYKGVAPPFITDQPSDKALPVGKGKGAYIPWASYVALHEAKHHVYRSLPGEVNAWITGSTTAQSDDVDQALSRGGDVKKELGPYLTDVIAWGALRNIPAKELVNNPDVMDRAARKNMSTTPEEAAETWDAFGEYLKKVKSWGIWTRAKWERMNAHRQLLFNYMPELARNRAPTTGSAAPPNLV